MADTTPIAVETRTQGAANEISTSQKRRWRSYIWDSLDKSPVERRFLFKLDAALLTFATLGYFIKCLDQHNINNAFVSGMKEDLKLYGNELNYMGVTWAVGYLVGQIPSNVLLTRIRPSIWLPIVELIWSILTICLAKCSTAEQIYGIRFLVGLFESTFYPGIQYVIGSWYRSDELAKRSCIFQTAAAFSAMVSGYLMAAVYHLGGNGGFAGWQWLFIVDGIISIPVALAGFFFLPDVPETTKAWYFNKADVSLAQKRMQLEGRKNREPYTKVKIRKIMTSWHIYALASLYMFYGNGSTGMHPIFAQYLKSSGHPKYTTSQINTYPTTTNACQIVATLFYAWTSDSLFNGRRWPPILIGGAANIVSDVSLAIWDVGQGWKWTSYILSGAGSGLAGIFATWANEICTSDNEERAIVIAAMHVFALANGIWLHLVVWRQVEAPAYRKGFITAGLMSAAMMVNALVIRALVRKELRKKKSTDSSNPSEEAIDLSHIDRSQAPAPQHQHPA